MSHGHCTTLQEGLVVVRASQEGDETGAQIFRRQGDAGVPLEHRLDQLAPTGR